MRSKDKLLLQEQAKEEQLQELFRGCFPNPNTRTYEGWLGFKAGFKLAQSFYMKRGEKDVQD